MSAARELRAKAAKARRLAAAITDTQARENLESLARKYDQEADEIERQGENGG